MDPLDIKPNTKNDHLYLPKIFPQVVFAWGSNRLMPVRIESIKIDEKKYNNKLIPISAEVTIQMSILVSDWVIGLNDEMKNTYDWMIKQRKKMSDKYYG